MTASRIDRLPAAFLAGFFVLVWGSGFLASKTALQYAAPLTFLCLRYLFGIACLLPFLVFTRNVWPRTPRAWLHLGVAGALVHAVHLGGSHYSQYLGLSAGITALIMALQPLITALIAARWMQQPLQQRQWIGVILGLAGVALVVWHKIHVQELPWGSLLALAIGITGVTAGTLYQRVYCPAVDLRTGAFIQFSVSAALLAPLAWTVEGAHIAWSWPLVGATAFLVIFSSFLATNVLHVLMRRGEAARATSMIYLTPIVAVALELPLFGVVPSTLSLLGIVITCVGVALVTWPATTSGQT